MTLDHQHSIYASDVARVIRTILEEDSRHNSFLLRPYRYQGRAILFDTSDTLLFEFPTLQSEFPELYSSSTYNLLFVLSEHLRSAFPLQVLNDIHRLVHKDNIDKVVLWLSHHLDDDLFEHLKHQGIDIIIQPLPSDSDLESRPIRHFVPLTNASLDYSLCVSHVGNTLVTRLRKLFHLILSEVAAPIYDEHYATHMVATKTIMEFEERTIEALATGLVSEGRASIAVDVGCGTGRHSFLLAKHFAEVFAFDLSPLMIQKAEEKKRACDDHCIVFWTNDFEYERLSEEQRFSGNADIIVASFGMASFVEDTVGMLRRFSQWLKPRGKIYLSFYNEHSSVLLLKPTWRDTSLASNINPVMKSLRVNLPGGVSFDIFCKPFNEGTKGEINKIFDIERLYTFPTILALLPNSLLKDDMASQLFLQVDEILASLVTPMIPARLQGNAKETALAAELEDLLSKYGEVGYGHYVIVVAKKPESPGAAYQNALQVLQQKTPDAYDIIRHGPVLSVRDACRELDVPLDAAVKTLIFKEQSRKMPREQQNYTPGGRFIAVSIPGNTQVDKDRLAEMLEIGRRSLRFASEKEVSVLGFPLEPLTE